MNNLGYRELSQSNQVMMSYVFVARKGLIETHLMPYMDIETKVFKLPQLNKEIRRFYTNPSHDKLFYNMVITNYYPYVDSLSLKQS